MQLAGNAISGPFISCLDGLLVCLSECPRTPAQEGPKWWEVNWQARRHAKSRCHAMTAVCFNKTVAWQAPFVFLVRRLNPHLSQVRRARVRRVCRCHSAAPGVPVTSITVVMWPFKLLKANILASGAPQAARKPARHNHAESEKMGILPSCGNFANQASHVNNSITGQLRAD